MNAIIVHGTSDKEEYYSGDYPSFSNAHWFPWLQNQLLIRDIRASTPEMYKAYNLNFEEWKKEFEKNDIDKDTILIGHSCGGGFILRWLSENKHIKVKTVILVSPWLDPNNEKNNTFFDFEIDKNILSQAKKFKIFTSTNDFKDCLLSLKIITKVLTNIEIRIFENYGHFCYSDLKTDAFPELLEEILS